MFRTGIVLIIAFLTSAAILAQDNINIESYQVIKLAKPPVEYTKKLDAFIKVHKSLVLGKNWILPFDSKKYLESKITGKKVTDEESFATSSLFLHIANKAILVDKDCFGFGKVTWNTKGDQFIYQRVVYPPTDYPVADICLVKINENGAVLNKKEIMKKIGYTDFNWSDNNIVVFSDFDIVYTFNTENSQTIKISGEWTKESEARNGGKGYPRWSNSFIWMSNKELVFNFKPDMYNEVSKIYKITFE